MAAMERQQLAGGRRFRQRHQRMGDAHADPYQFYLDNSHFCRKKPHPNVRPAIAATAMAGIIADMQVLLVSEPSAADRPNEDFAAAVPGAVVLLDGAGYQPESGIGCVHGIAWYARTLGGLLAAGALARARPALQHDVCPNLT